MQQTRAPLSSWYAVGILSVTVLYAMMDRQVLSLLAQPMKTALDLSDTQIGSLQGLGAALFSAVAVVPLGWLADRVDRRILLASCILVWSAAIASCGFSTGYGTLLLSAAFLGAGESGLNPIVFALIPELFPERQRVSANFIYYAATILGSGAGIALAGAAVANIGLVVPHLSSSIFTRETWRLVFFAVAVPGPFLALAIMFIRLQRRTVQPRHDAPFEIAAIPPRLLDHLGANWRAIFGVFGPYGMALLGAFAILNWLPVVLMRNFNLTAGAVGAGVGSAFIVGSIAGLVIAAALAPYARSKWGDATPLRFSHTAYLLYGLIAPLYLFARSANELFLIATVLMAIGVGGNSLMPTMLQDLAPGPLRGRTFAISTVIFTFFTVMSPIVVGLFSDHIFTQPGGLLISMVTVCAPSFFIASICLRLAEKHVMRTVQSVRAQAAAA